MKTPNGKLHCKNHHRLISQCLFWLLIDINWFASANEEMLIVSLECALELILNGNTKVDWKSYGMVSNEMNIMEDLTVETRIVAKLPTHNTRFRCITPTSSIINS